MNRAQNAFLTKITAAALPVLPGAQSLEKSIQLCSAVLAAILVFEILVYLKKKIRARFSFPPRFRTSGSEAACSTGNIRFPVPRFGSIFSLTALLVSAGLLTLIAFGGDLLWPGTWKETASIFPMSFASALLLGSFSRPEANTPRQRTRLWIAFTLLLLFAGVLQDKTPALAGFLPFPFWILALMALVSAFSAFRRPA